MTLTTMRGLWENKGITAMENNLWTVSKWNLGKSPVWRVFFTRWPKSITSKLIWPSSMLRCPIEEFVPSTPAFHSSVDQNLSIMLCLLFAVCLFLHMWQYFCFIINFSRAFLPRNIIPAMSCVLAMCSALCFSRPWRMEFVWFEHSSRIFLIRVLT